MNRWAKWIGALIMALLLLTLAYGASLPSLERTCALRWSDGLSTERCVQRAHE